jgi:hypothetical protein
MRSAFLPGYPAGGFSISLSALLFQNQINQEKTM